VGQLSKFRRMHLRQGVLIKEVARRLDLSKNTVKKWLRADTERERVGQPLAASQAYFSEWRKKGFT
jgi:transposase-like protein